MPAQPTDLLGVLLMDHEADYPAEGRTMPTQLTLFGPDQFSEKLWDDGIIAQFWDCPDREEFAKRCRYSLMAGNMLAAGLPVPQRSMLLADYADMILELFPDCIGIYWPHSQRLVPRERFRQTGWRTPELHFLDGGLNVRFFRINGSEEMLFDTLGLTPLGLPDLQCHCKGLEPGWVVGFLRNLAAYLFQQGDVIEDGNTVEGIGGGKWLCRREDAMAEPMRMVLDINAGEYAGGDRTAG